MRLNSNTNGSRAIIVGVLALVGAVAIFLAGALLNSSSKETIVQLQQRIDRLEATATAAVINIPAIKSMEQIQGRVDRLEITDSERDKSLSAFGVAIAELQRRLDFIEKEIHSLHGVR